MNTLLLKNNWRFCTAEIFLENAKPQPWLSKLMTDSSLFDEQRGFFYGVEGGDKIITNHFILTLNHDNASLHDSYDEYFRDVVKLTAQFVARNGRQFLTNLMNREQRNYQFDFLRPQHSLFNYFTKLVEQYTKVCPTASSN